MTYITAYHEGAVKLKMVWLDCWVVLMSASFLYKNKKIIKKGRINLKINLTQVW